MVLGDENHEAMHDAVKQYNPDIAFYGNSTVAGSATNTTGCPTHQHMPASQEAFQDQ